jgi:hypothetical protein
MDADTRFDSRLFLVSPNVKLHVGQGVTKNNNLANYLTRPGRRVAGIGGSLNINE